MAAFNELLDGYRRFRGKGWSSERERWSKLAEGQSPKSMVIACSDSRVDPAEIFDTRPGEIFVVRNIANFVPPFESDNGQHGVSAALEYAVTQLKVEEIVVVGHAKCGGCKAALTQVFAGAAPGEGGFVQGWVQLLDGARERVVARCGDGPDAEREMEHEGVRTSIANLRTFPFVREAEAAGRLTLRGAYFAIPNGEVQVMDEEGVFTPA